MTTERTIIAILVAFILGVLFTATSVGGTVLEPIQDVLRPSASPGPAPVNLMNFQGELTDPGTGDPVADGSYSIRFSVWDADAAGNEEWNETQPAVGVSGGLFSVLLGSVNALTADVFGESPRYLEVKVGADPAMAPRQQFVTVPYAFHAVNAWALDGNSGTTAGTDIIGTTDSEPFELHVDGARALRLEPGGVPNLIGGYSGNSVTSGVGAATIGGGGASGVDANRVTDNHGTVSGGKRNLAGDDMGTTLDSTDATVGGGDTNTASATYATVGGGAQNTASGGNSTVAGGNSNTASFGGATVGGGDSNSASGEHATIAGGLENLASFMDATIGGGRNNIVTGGAGTVSGGFFNTAGSTAFVGGGHNNSATADYATIAGGGGGDPATGNHVTDTFGTISGGGNNQAGDNAGTTNDSPGATVGGGANNTAGAANASVGGGLDNIAGGEVATVGGGRDNTASGFRATVGGGYLNTASTPNTTVAGGLSNTASANSATVGGGFNNTASATRATVGGGRDNAASGWAATIAGGYYNTAAGDFSFAAGRLAKIAAAHDGAFLFADQNDFDFNSAAANEFAVRSTGGARVVTAIDGGSGNPTAGVKLDPGDNAWEVLSDRDSKENYVLLDAREILERLSGVPITEWNYRAQDASNRHIGPTAQDFYAAFGLSDDERYISPIDTDGVALAAIQGLYELAQEQQAQIAALRDGLGEQPEGATAPSLAASPSSSSGLSSVWLGLGAGLFLAALVLGQLGATALRRTRA